MDSVTDEEMINEIQDISEQLIERGYTENEINRAFAWLFENIPESNQFEGKNQDQLSSNFNGRNWLSLIKSNPQCGGFDLLYQFRELEIVGEEEIEEILNQCLLKGKAGISISEIKAIVDSLVMDLRGDVSSSFFIMNRKKYGH